MMNCVRQIIGRVIPAAVLLVLWAGLTGCQTTPTSSQSPPASGGVASAAPSSGGAATATTGTNASLVLREGDTIHIAFPGAPNLDSTQTIRRDGKITMDVGEFTAAGLTPHELEEQLLAKYGPQLVIKEVTVTVQTATFAVYVSGAVLRPGKIVAERTLTPLEAVLEAGLDQTRANLKKVAVVRENENGSVQRYVINLDSVIKGKSSEPFTLKPQDKIFVPEKFSMF